MSSRIALSLLLFSLGLLAVPRQAALGQERQAEPARSRAYSIAEAGQDRLGNPLFTVRAHGADLKEFLGALLAAAKREFTIDERVRGRVDLTLPARSSLESVLFYCQNVTRAFWITVDAKGAIQIQPPSSSPGIPPGVILPGNVNAEALQSLLQSRRTETPGFGYPGNPYLNRSIQFSIPDAQPVKLRQALDMLARQSGMRFRLHPDIRPDVLFSGTVNRLPLRSVLDSLGRTANFSWQLQRDGSVLITPLARVERPPMPKTPESRKSQEEEEE